jgi:hypothetical protein
MTIVGPPLSPRSATILFFPCDRHGRMGASHAPPGTKLARREPCSFALLGRGLILNPPGHTVLDLSPTGQRRTIGSSP